MTSAWGNPSSRHEVGRTAAMGLNAALEDVAAILNCHPEEIYFCSGGTEANNHALKAAGSGSIVASSIEHKSILAPLAEPAFKDRTALVKVDLAGSIDLGHLGRLLENGPALCTVMYANNEVGTVQPIAAVSEMCKNAGVLLHVDAVQAPAHLSLDVKSLGVDLMSLSAHKFGGPRGVGALFVKSGVNLPAFVLGGGQQRGMRSGTVDVAGAVGMSVALRIAEENRAQVDDLIAKRNRLMNGVLAAVPDAMVTGSREQRLANHASFCFPGVNGESLLVDLERQEIMCSSGSACDGDSPDVSHVLEAMGVPDDLARTALRFSLDHSTTDREVHDTVLAVRRSVKNVKALA